MRTFRLLIIVIAFSFFAVYTVVWSILEPIPISDSCQWLRWYFILGLSLLVTLFGLFKQGFLFYIFYRFIRPIFINELQSLSTNQSDDPLSNGWYEINWHTREPNESNPKHPVIVDDNLFKKACNFDDGITRDAIHGLKLSVRERATKIDYFLKPTSENPNNAPVIYLRIALRNITNPLQEHNDKKWLTLVIDKVHNAESVNHSDEEETIFIKSKFIFSDWMFFSENIEERVNRIDRWKGIYSFNNIESIKVRGQFRLAFVKLY